MTLAPLPAAQRRRLAFLAAGNAALVLLIFALLKPGASFADVLFRAGPDVAPVLLAGLGMTLIVFTGGIDLSVGSLVALAGTVLGILALHGAPAGVGFAGVIVAVAGLSAFNGWLSGRLRLPAIIVTLGGLAAYRGLALIGADALVPGFAGSLSLPAGPWRAPGRELAWPILLGVLAAALVWERAGRLPRLWLGVGSSEEAVRLAGLDPARLRWLAFGFGGLFLAAGALLLVTGVQVIEPARLARGFELQVIGAVILGGTNIFGGEGTLAGTALGALFLHFIGQALVFAGVSPYWQEVLTGALILAVIGLDCALYRRRQRMEELA